MPPVLRRCSIGKGLATQQKSHSFSNFHPCKLYAHTALATGIPNRSRTLIPIVVFRLIHCDCMCFKDQLASSVPRRTSLNHNPRSHRLAIHPHQHPRHLLICLCILQWNPFTLSRSTPALTLHPHHRRTTFVSTLGFFSLQRPWSYPRC